MRGSVSPCSATASSESEAPSQKRAKTTSKAVSSPGSETKEARAAAPTCSRQRTSTSARARQKVSSRSTLVARPTSRSARPNRTTDSSTASSAAEGSGDLAPTLPRPLHQRGQLAPAHPLEVVASLQERPKRSTRCVRFDLSAAQLRERARPVERLPDSRHPVQIEPAQLLHERAHLAYQRQRHLG